MKELAEGAAAIAFSLLYLAALVVVVLIPMAVIWFVIEQLG